MRDVIVMMAIHSLHVMGKPIVNLTLETETIKLGKSLILTCTVYGISKINPDVTRQFAKGNNGLLLCYNGHIKQKEKYKEIVSNGNTFSLMINNVTESDVNSIYQCRYRFSTVKQMIGINEMNFEYEPTENTTLVEISKCNNNSFKIQMNFTKIFPVPECSAHTKTWKLKFNYTSVVKERIFYKVSFMLMHDVDEQCDTELEIYCTVGRSTHYNKTIQFTQCSSTFPTTVKLTLICLSGVIFIVVIFLTVLSYKKRRKRKSRKKKKDIQTRKTLLLNANEVTSV